ncbi:MAG: Holliday junction branch migration protein RuvA [Lentisphaeria bacterium]
MIGRLTGKLIQCNLTQILLDVHGVGYDLTVPLSTTDKLPPIDQTVTILTHLHVREDCLQLFGFMTTKERDLFRLMINAVSGIGPRLALNILSSMSVDHFCTAVVNKDLKLLGKISGIGKRTAERIILELQDKVTALNPNAGSSSTDIGTSPDTIYPNAADAIAALETLGFKKESATKTIQKICSVPNGEKITAASLIRQALAKLNS